MLKKLIAKYESNRNLYGIIIVISFCLVGLLIGLFKIKALKGDHVLGEGEITKVERLAKSANPFVNFRFYVKNKEIIAKNPVWCNSNECLSFLKNFLRGKKMPVIYRPNHPKNCKVLLTSKDFREYKIEIPSEYKQIVNSLDSMIAKD